MTTHTFKKLGLSLCSVAGAAAIFVAAGPALTADDDPAPEPAPTVAVDPPTTPPALKKAIRNNQVTVVIVHAKRATFDALALREARAGAARASAKFIAVDTSNEKTISTWVKRYPELKVSPTVLVFGRDREEPMSKLTVFSDREVVAQAATNARIQVIAAAQRKAKAKVKKKTKG